MIEGIGFFEIIVIFLLLLLFFGSKELPDFIRLGAKMITRLRKYSHSIRKELNEITSIDDSKPAQFPNDVRAKKEHIRKLYRLKRSNLTDKEVSQNSKKIYDHIISYSKYTNSKTIMLYVSKGNEIKTDGIIKNALNSGKRVILPYCRNSRQLGIAEILDPEKDLVSGKYDILEPKNELRDNFLKSDLDIVFLPGVAFDPRGNRIGRGRGYYDSFLSDLKGRIPLIGIAHHCQISNDILPSYYNDITCDNVLTEQGFLIKE